MISGRLRRRGQRLITTDEVGALAAFLVSDDSSAMWTPAIAEWRDIGFPARSNDKQAVLRAFLDTAHHNRQRLALLRHFAAHEVNPDGYGDCREKG
jgi:hypothetical protein